MGAHLPAQRVQVLDLPACRRMDRLAFRVQRDLRTLRVYRHLPRQAGRHKIIVKRGPKGLRRFQHRSFVLGFGRFPPCVQCLQGGRRQGQLRGLSVLGVRRSDRENSCGLVHVGPLQGPYLVHAQPSRQHQAIGERVALSFANATRLRFKREARRRGRAVAARASRVPHGAAQGSGFGGGQKVLGFRYRERVAVLVGFHVPAFHALQRVIGQHPAHRRPIQHFDRGRAILVQGGRRQRRARFLGQPLQVLGQGVRGQVAHQERPSPGLHCFKLRFAVVQVVLRPVRRLGLEVLFDQVRQLQVGCADARQVVMVGLQFHQHLAQLVGGFLLVRRVRAFFVRASISGAVFESNPNPPHARAASFF